MPSRGYSLGDYLCQCAGEHGVIRAGIVVEAGLYNALAVRNIDAGNAGRCEQFGDAVRFVAISRAQTAEEVSAWWKQNGIGIPFSAQADRKVYELFASSRIPRIYISDREGIVQACFDDNPCPDYERLSGALTKVIAP